jgi:gliding motility-associated-like protein
MPHKCSLTSWQEITAIVITFQKTACILGALLAFQVSLHGQTPSDTLIGMVNKELVKIDKFSGSITPYQMVSGIPPGDDPIRLTWCPPNSCFYTLTQTYPPVLAKIDLNGIYTVIGTLTYPAGSLFMCEGLSFNRSDNRLYVSGSLNGNPNSSPPDFYSEALLRVDTTNLTTTFVGFFNGPSANTEADAIAFDANGTLYFYDGQPGQFNQFYRQDMNFSTPPLLLYSSGYISTRDLTVNGNELFFSQDRVLKKINTGAPIFSNIGTMFGSADFSGELVRGITWNSLCPNKDILGTDTTICQGDSVLISPTIQGDSYTWSDGTSNDNLIANTSGTYTVQVDSVGCVFEDEITVTVEHTPNVDLGPDVRPCVGESTLLEVDNPNVFINWSTGSSEPFTIVTEDGTYSVTVTNACGSDADTIRIESEMCFCEMYVPNTFTPNDDGLNNTFVPMFDCAIHNYSLEIYNRWGEMVFESTDPYEVWDGTFKGAPAQMGIYSYKIIYSSENFIGKTVFGHVNLMR